MGLHVDLGAVTLAFTTVLWWDLRPHWLVEAGLASLWVGPVTFEFVYGD